MHNRRKIVLIIGSTQKHAYIGDGQISPTLTSAMGEGGGHVPMIVEDHLKIRVANKKGYQEAYPGDGVCTEHPSSKTRRGRVQPQMTGTLDTGAHKTVVMPDYRIRKLTPVECWLLMGFEKSDIDKCIAAGISNTQLYKQAGNSIVVQCLEGIFNNMFQPDIEYTPRIGGINND